MGDCRTLRRSDFDAVMGADYEFHSSGMHKFEIWGTDGHHSDEEGWKKLATCEASRSKAAKFPFLRTNGCDMYSFAF